MEMLQLKHATFDADNVLIDIEGTCTDCQKPYTMFMSCDCDLATMDENRAMKLPENHISIAVVTTEEGNQEVVKATSLKVVREESHYLSSFLEDHPDVRSVECLGAASRRQGSGGYQRPEPDFLFLAAPGTDEYGDAWCSVNFFAVAV